jgi:hypothetical protein
MPAARVVPVLFWPTLVLLLITQVGCGAQRREPSISEYRQLASWIEDVARGLPRDADELVVPTASQGYADAAQWARGSDVGRQRTWPPPLFNRATRWPRLATALRDGSVVLAPGGLVAPRPDLPPARRLVVDPLADQENLDRRIADRVVSGLIGDAQAWQEVVAGLRALRDREAGGTTWAAPKK